MAEYQGKKVKLNSPFRLSDGSDKKFGVYVKNDKNNIVKVKFGDGSMNIKRASDKKRKSFRKRHNCSDPGPKHKARYWSCKMWQKNTTVSDLLGEDLMLKEIIRSELRKIFQSQDKT